MTHTYATLEISKPAYEEIRSKLKEAGYEHAFHDDGLIDMHGIGIAVQEEVPGAKTVRERLAQPHVPHYCEHHDHCMIAEMNWLAAHPGEDLPEDFHGKAL